MDGDGREGVGMSGSPVPRRSPFVSCDGHVWRGSIHRGQISVTGAHRGGEQARGGSIIALGCSEVLHLKNVGWNGRLHMSIEGESEFQLIHNWVPKKTAILTPFSVCELKCYRMNFIDRRHAEIKCNDLFAPDMSSVESFEWCFFCRKTKINLNY